jgi:hypothetical protein
VRISWLSLKTKVDGCEWFGLKTTRTVFTSLASKLVATVSSGLVSKPTATVFAGLASKPVATVFSSLASKLVATVSPDLASKPTVGFLVEPQNQGGGGFPGLGLKIGSTVSHPVLRPNQMLIVCMPRIKLSYIRSECKHRIPMSLL